jgi:hypothetical protein
MIWTIALIGLGVWGEKRFSPRFKVENRTVYFYYTAKKGSRNKEKLF